MRINLQVRYDDASGHAHTFSREVDRPYPGVPRAGDAVFLGEVHPDGSYLQERRISEVRFENDGRISLLFRFDGLINDPNPQIAILKAEGFR